jgi:hypothetical protein
MDINYGITSHCKTLRLHVAFHRTESACGCHTAHYAIPLRWRVLPGDAAPLLLCAAALPAFLPHCQLHGKHARLTMAVRADGSGWIAERYGSAAMFSLRAATCCPLAAPYCHLLRYYGLHACWPAPPGCTAFVEDMDGGAVCGFANCGYGVLFGPGLLTTACLQRRRGVCHTATISSLPDAYRAAHAAPDGAKTGDQFPLGSRRHHTAAPACEGSAAHCAAPAR